MYMCVSMSVCKCLCVFVCVCFCVCVGVCVYTHEMAHSKDIHVNGVIFDDTSAL